MGANPSGRRHRPCHSQTSEYTVEHGQVLQGSSYVRASKEWITLLTSSQNARREFHSAPVLFARVASKKIVLTKAQLAAKARKKAAKAPKNIYDAEKMPLSDAIAVLRVSLHMHLLSRLVLH